MVGGAGGIGGPPEEEASFTPTPLFISADEGFLALLARGLEGVGDEDSTEWVDNTYGLDLSATCSTSLRKG